MTALSLGIFLTIHVQKEKPAFTFAGSGYYSRYVKGNLHEFTPKDQPNLDKFTDMVTINKYASVKDGDALAATANSVLELYQNNKAVIVKTSSVPRTDKKPAEHLIVGKFVREGMVEISYARFLLRKEVGYSVVYSHRAYGKKAVETMNSWLKQVGANREKDLMAFSLTGI
jgi:hypothetical protein